MGIIVATLITKVSRNLTSITFGRYHEHVADILYHDNPEIMYGELQGLKEFLLDVQNDGNYNHSLFSSHPSIKSRVTNIDNQITLLEKKYPHLVKN